MYIEFRLRSRWLLHRMLNEFRKAQICIPEVLELGFVQGVVNFIEFAEAASIERRASVVPVSITTQDGAFVIPDAYDIFLHQPVIVNFAPINQLETNQKAPSIGNGVEITLQFRLRMGIGLNGVARYLIEYSDVDLGPLLGQLPEAPTIRARIDAAVANAASNVPGATGWTNLPISLLSPLLHGPVNATNAGVAVTASSGEMLVFRIELNGPSQSAHSDWTDFYTDDFQLGLPAGVDWQVYMPEDIILRAIKDRISDGFATAQSKGELIYSGGTHATWDPLSTLVLAQSAVEVPDACTAVILFVPVSIDLDVDVTQTIQFSVPVPNRIRVAVRVYLDVDDAEAWACALSALFFFPTVATYTWAEGNSIKCFAGGCIDIGMTGIFLTPIAIFAGILVAAALPGEAFSEGIETSELKKIEDTDADLEFRQTYDVSGLPLDGMELTEIRGTSDSMNLDGVLPQLDTIRHPAELGIDYADEKFSWGFDRICSNSPKFTASARIGFRDNLVPGPIHTSLEVCDVRIIEDPQNQYSPYLELDPGDNLHAPSIRIKVPYDEVLPDFSGYDCKVLIFSNGGSRLITIAAFEAVSPSIVNQLEYIIEGYKAVHCHNWYPIDKDWSIDSLFWAVDPPPYETDTEQILLVSLSDVEQGSELVVRDAADNVLGYSTVDRSRKARISVVVGAQSEATGLSLHVTSPGDTFLATGPSRSSLKGPRDSENLGGKLGLLQVAMTREPIPVSETVSHVSLGRFGRGKCLFAVTKRWLDVLDVTKLGTADHVLRYETTGWSGFVPLRTGGIFWGQDGAQYCPLEPKGPQAVQILSEPVLDAKYLRSYCYLLLASSLIVVDQECKISSSVTLEKATHLATAGEHVIVGVNDHLLSFLTNEKGRPRIVGRVRVPNLRLLRSLEDIPGGGAAFLYASEGTPFRVAEIHSGGRLRELASFIAEPELLTAARLGTLRAFVNRDKQAILARIYSGRQLSHAEIEGRKPLDTERLPPVRLEE